MAQILGVGSESKFRKEDQILEEDADNLRLGQFQLPDLGSKYMRASAANGRYDNIIIIDPETSRTFQRVGVEVELSLNQGTSIDIFYTGEFTIPNIPITFSPSANFVSSLPSSTDQGSIADTQMLSHGHYSNSAITWRSRGINTDTDAQFDVTGIDIATGGPKVTDQNDTPDSGYEVDPQENITSPAGSDSSTLHTHSISKSTITKSLSSNISTYGVEASNIVTTANFSSKNTFKLDDIQHRFILVEFLIKT